MQLGTKSCGKESCMVQRTALRTLVAPTPHSLFLHRQSPVRGGNAHWFSRALLWRTQ